MTAKNNRTAVTVTVNKKTYNQSRAVLARHGTNPSHLFRNLVRDVADLPRLKKIWSHWTIMLVVQCLEFAVVGMYLSTVFPPVPRLRDLGIVLVYAFAKIIWLIYNVSTAKPGHLQWWRFL